MVTMWLFQSILSFRSVGGAPCGTLLLGASKANSRFANKQRLPHYLARYLYSLARGTDHERLRHTDWQAIGLRPIKRFAIRLKYNNSTEDDAANC